MNQIAHPPRDMDVITRARDIVGRHALPSFILSYEVRLGTLHDSAALFVVYKTSGDDRFQTIDQRLANAAAYRELDSEILTELLDEFEDRIPISLLE